MSADRVIAFPPEAVLSVEDVAAWLRVSVRKVEQLPIPCLYLGSRTKRYLGKSVLQYLEGLEDVA